ncbi:MAG: hypothetical protein JWN78_1286 [Bacteroidota bacterium]|nr:hypothetical protein [Bacteroidota bacterium]
MSAHLSEKDKENIAVYFQSPVFAQKKSYYKLFESVVQHKDNCNKAVLWNSVYPKQKLDEQKFRKLCFETLQQVEYCLSINHILQDDQKIQQHLIQYYLEYEIADFFKTKIDKARKINSANEKYGADNYLHQYHLEHLHFLYLQKRENAQTLNIAESSNALDKFYFLQKLKYICNTINYKAILGKTEPISFEEEIILFIERSALGNDVLMSIYLAIYYLLKTPETEENFFNGRSLVISHADRLENSEFSDIIQYLINYCIKKINQSADEYLDHLFDIYTLYLKKIREKVFSPIRFKNIFLLALKMKKYEWAEKFIEEYGGKLPSEQRETTIAYNKARLFYDTKQYDKVLDTLLNLYHDEVQFNLISKVLIVKTFYEKNEIQFLENYMLSFKAYILRNKEMNLQNKNIHLNFLKMMNKLIRVEYQSKNEIEKFKTRIETFPNLPDKNWFLEKTKDL